MSQHDRYYDATFLAICSCWSAYNSCDCSHYHQKLIDTADTNKLTKAVGKVSFQQSEIINSELVMVKSARHQVTLNKPSAVGFTILELSKLIMYRFYYDHLKHEYADRCTLLFNDTDSLCCHIKTENIYQDMSNNLEIYDTSNFDRDHAQYSKTNRKVLGKFKSETGSAHQWNLLVCMQKCTVWMY